MQMKSNYTQCLKYLGKAIKRERRACGLTQEEVGERVSLDRVTIGYIEQGRRAPSIHTLLSFAQLYHVPVSAFFSEIDDNYETIDVIVTQEEILDVKVKPQGTVKVSQQPSRRDTRRDTKKDANRS